MAVVVVRDGRTRVGRCRPHHRQPRHRRRLHRRRIRLARCLGVHVRHRHRDRLGRRLDPLALAARRRNLHHVRVVRPLVFGVLEVRYRLEGQGAVRRPDLEQCLIRPAGDRVARDVVLRIGVRRQHLASRRLVLRRVERCRRAERRRRVGVRAAAARVRPGTGALVVGRPHLHLVGRVLRQAHQRRRGGRANVVAVAPAPAVARPVLHVVIGDGRTRVGRRRPHHRQPRHRRRLHRRRIRLARCLGVHVRHRHRDRLGRRLDPLALAARRRNLHHVLVVASGIGRIDTHNVLRVLEVRRRLEGQGAVRRPDLEQCLIRPAGDRVARDVVLRIGVRRQHLASRRLVLRRVERCRRAERRRRVGVRAAAARVRPVAGALVVRRPYLHLVGRVLRQVHQRRRDRGAVVAPVAPVAAVARPVLHVVIGDGRTRVGRCRPHHRQPRHRRRLHRRRIRLARCLGVHVRHRHRDRLGRRLDPLALAARRRNLHHVRVVRPLVFGVLEVRYRLEGQGAVRRPDLEQCLIRPAGDRVARDVVLRIGVRRQHLASRRLVLRRVKRRRRAERRCRVGVRRAAARVRPVAGALVVGGPHLHLVGRVLRQVHQRRRDRGAVVAPVAPVAAVARPVLHVVIGDGRTRVGRRRPHHRQPRHRRWLHRRRIRLARCLGVHVRHRHRDRLRCRLLPLARAARRRNLHHVLVVASGIGRIDTHNVLRVLEVRRRLEGQGAVRRPDLEQCLIRPAGDRVARDVVLRIGVRRQHLASRRLVLRRVERCRRAERRRRVGVRAAAARVRPVAGALVVRRPYLHLVGRVLRQAHQRRRDRGAVVAPVAPVAAVARPVLHVVIGDGRTRVGRCRPHHRQPRHRRRLHRRRIRLARCLGVHVRHRHRDRLGRRLDPLALAARRRNLHHVRVVRPLVFGVLEVRYRLEGQGAVRRPDLEQCLIRPAGDRVARDVVLRIGVRRQHLASRRLVLRRVKRRRRAERRCRVGVRRAAARVRPVAGALVVGGPHLHLVGRVLRQVHQRRRDRGAVVAPVAPVAAVARPVLHVVIGDGRTRVGRRRPVHRQPRHRRWCHRRRIRLARCLGVHVRHRHRDRLGRRLDPLALAARRRNLHHVLVVASGIGRIDTHNVLRVLEVRRRLEGQRPGRRHDGEEPLVRPAGDRVALDAVIRIGVRRQHRASRRLVLRRVKRRRRAERRCRVGVRRAAARVRPVAGALVVGGPHLHLVGRVLRQAREHRRGGRAGVAPVAPVAAVARPVLHVVIGDGRTRVGRCRPHHRQPRHRRRRHRRRIRLARCLGVHIRHRHRDRLRRRLLPLPLAARRRNLHHVRVVRPLVFGVLEVRYRLEGQGAVRRPDLEQCLIRPAGDRVARDVVLRIGVRRQHLASRRLVLRRVERCRRAERRRRVGVRLPAARVRPGTGALVVGRPHLHLVGRVLRQAHQRRRGGRANVVAVAPAPAVARPVLHVVIGDGRTRVGRRRPVHPQARHRRGLDRRRIRLARCLGVHVRHRHRDRLGRRLDPLALAARRRNLHHVLVVASGIGRIDTHNVLRVLEVRRRLEGQRPRRRHDGEEPLVRPAGDRVALDAVIRIGVRRQHRASHRLVLRRVERRRRAERRCRVGVRRAAARVRPVAGALVVGRPHLHLIGGVLRQAPDRRRGGGDRRVRDLRPVALRRGRPVAVIVVRDRRTRVGRRRPVHPQARHRRGLDRRRVRLARCLAAHVGHRHRDRLRCRLDPLARAARRRHLHHVGVVAPLVLRVLVVGGRIERQRPRPSPRWRRTPHPRRP